MHGIAVKCSTEPWLGGCGPSWTERSAFGKIIMLPIFLQFPNILVLTILMLWLFRRHRSFEPFERYGRTAPWKDWSWRNVLCRYLFGGSGGFVYGDGCIVGCCCCCIGVGWFEPCRCCCRCCMIIQWSAFGIWQGRRWRWWCDASLSEVEEDGAMIIPPLLPLAMMVATTVSRQWPQSSSRVARYCYA